MPKDRDQLTPDDPEDAEHLVRNRGQGTGGTGLDELDAAERLGDESTLEPRPPE